MKRILMMLVSLMIATPLFAKDGLTRQQEKNLAKYRKEATATLNNTFNVPVSSGVFELTCTTKDGNHSSEAFELDLSSASEPVKFPTKLFKELKDHDGYCLLGPVNLEARKQAALANLDAQIRFFRLLLQAVNEERLHGEVVHPQPK